MENLNQQLFLLANASSAPPMLLVEVARSLAQGAIWVVPIGVIAGWLRGSRQTREVLVAAAVAGLLGLGINQLIGFAWYHPRPFEMGLGHAWLAHVRDSSFPSDHLTVIWAAAFVLLAQPATRTAGAALAVLGVPVAWARIYLGVHFPLDMAGAALVALASATVMMNAGRRLPPVLMRRLMPMHHLLLAPLIARGWVTK